MRATPLSFQQEETLRNMRRSPGSDVAYDTVLVFRLRGAVDEKLLAEALRATVNRHPELRTTVAASPSGHVQRLWAKGDPAPVGLHEESESTGEMAAKLLGARYGLAEVLAGQPLFRAGVHRAGADLHLVFAIHHLIFDGWSTGLLLRDLSEFYTALVEHRGPVLPPVQLSYADFAGEQHAAWERLREEAVEFWGEELAGCTGQVAWPRPPAGGAATDTGSIEQVRLSSRAVAAVRTTARRERVTPFTVLLTATAVSVARLTGTIDLFAGSDTANREDSRKHQTIGYFTNTRFSRLRAAPGRPVEEMVRDVRRTFRDTERLADVYSGKLLEALGQAQPIKINLSPPPGAAGRALRLPGAEAEHLPVRTLVRYWRDFTMQWFAGTEEITGGIWYRHAGIGQPAVERLAAGLDRVLTSEFGRAAA
ncbi:condensation domain-containing protein [Streptomyces sp. NPDC059853]|uniref:condensation domain-containing protein n=1 Tax=Streptomyces sp. NPDC059853 TaxID=3346973 RepID=UPI00365ADEA5